MLSVVHNNIVVVVVVVDEWMIMLLLLIVMMLVWVTVEHQLNRAIGLFGPFAFRVWIGRCACVFQFLLGGLCSLSCSLSVCEHSVSVCGCGWTNAKYQIGGSSPKRLFLSLALLLSGHSES